MPAQLLALSSGPNILLDKPILLLGRHPECDIQIDSRKISRRHCCIAQVSDYLVIRDLGSTNGIRINGVRLNEGRLKEGDEVTIGNNRYKVCWDGAAQSPPQPRGRLTPETDHVHSELNADEILESCDEPIPLRAPSSPLPKRRTALDRPDANASEALSVGNDEDQSMILPEKLELRPKSDVYPGAGKQPPSCSRPGS